MIVSRSCTLTSTLLEVTLVEVSIGPAGESPAQALGVIVDAQLPRVEPIGPTRVTERAKYL